MKNQRSRVVVQSDSEDDGPRTSTPLGRGGGEGGFFLAAMRAHLSVCVQE